MLLYSKIHDLLTGKPGTASTPATLRGGAEKSKSGLNCTVKEIYGVNDRLKYVYFHTKTDIPCLLHIPDKHEVNMGSWRFIRLVEWSEAESLNSVLAADHDFSSVKKIKAAGSPLGYIRFLKKLKPSLSTIEYNVALLTDEFLVVDEDDEIKTYNLIGTHSKKLLIVLDIETLLFKNIIPEIERVHRGITKLVEEDNEDFWKLLLTLLKKCKDIKIITKGRDASKNSEFISESIKLHSAYTAVKTALEYFE